MPKHSRLHHFPAIGFTGRPGQRLLHLGGVRERESEFLQMRPTCCSPSPVPEGRVRVQEADEAKPEDESPTAKRDDPDAPWPVHRGGCCLSSTRTRSASRWWRYFCVLRARTGGQYQADERGGSLARAAATDDGSRHSLSGVLVRELPELAKRVPVDRRAAGARDLPAGARLARVQARGRPARGDGALTTPGTSFLRQPRLLPSRHGIPWCLAGPYWTA